MQAARHFHCLCSSMHCPCVPFIGQSYRIWFNIVFLCDSQRVCAKMDRIGPQSVGDAPPTTPRHFWVIFGTIICSTQDDQNHENVQGPEKRFFWKMITISKTRIATTRILTVWWAPHLPYGAHSWKSMFWQTNTQILWVVIKTSTRCGSSGLPRVSMLKNDILNYWKCAFD